MTLIRALPVTWWGQRSRCSWWSRQYTFSHGETGNQLAECLQCSDSLFFVKLGIM